MQIATAMQYIASKGIVHRELTPQVIMLAGNVRFAA
jgi:hypothetical protein